MEIRNIKAKPTVSTVAMTTAGTEYSYQLPVGTRMFSIKLRDPGYPLYLAMVTGFTTIYFNIAQGEIHEEDNVKGGPTTLYFKTTADSQICEILTFK